MIYPRSWLLTLVALLLWPLRAHGGAYTCPESVEVPHTLLPLGSSPGGDVVFVPQTRVWLTGVSLYDGPPEEMASLMPWETSRRGDVSTWLLIATGERVTWVSCDYALGVVKVAAPMGVGLQSCTARTTGGRRGTPLAITVECLGPSSPTG